MVKIATSQQYHRNGLLGCEIGTNCLHRIAEHSTQMNNILRGAATGFLKNQFPQISSQQCGAKGVLPLRWD